MPWNFVTMNSCLGIGNPGSLLISFHLFDTGNLGFPLFLVVVGRLRLTIFGVIFLDCCVGGKSLSLVHFVSAKNFFDSKDFSFCWKI